MGNSPEGRLIFHVWPAHIGFGGDGVEFLPADRRAQIQWRPQDGTVVGSARAWVPAGVYSSLVFFNDLDGPPCGSSRFAHPFVNPKDGWVDVDPIENNDPVVGQMDGVAR